MPSIVTRIKNLFTSKAVTKQSTVSAELQQNGALHQPQQQGTPRDIQQQPLQTHDRAIFATPKKLAVTATGQLTIELQNQTSSSTVYAYITGQAIDNSNAVFVLLSDAKTPYYPPNPSSTGAKLAPNISIPLGAPGTSVYATIPRTAGGRIWFSINAPLVFLVNPSPALVEPSIFNPADPNSQTNFGFAEFTFNAAQLFANISYVDFVGPPIALTLLDAAGTTQHVSGLPATGLQTIADGLAAQTLKDGRRWSSLVVRDANNQLLRILSPNSGILLNPTWFQGYYAAYVNQVYARYTATPLTVDTQASFGSVKGQVGSLGNLNFGAGGLFAKPTAADIFSCSTGPFATGGRAEANTIIPRLAAAFNRSTLLLTNSVPDGESVALYYTEPITNHYSRIVHAANLDGRGYAFPYDDVASSNEAGQEGAVFSSSPVLFTVAVGGGNAHV
ncbi:hypothetical protein LTR08_002096 [Meristemomyces frigidus]|nr:hypothetical protein LTR08_002096 [Meristemomyces frigidus]